MERDGRQDHRAHGSCPIATRASGAAPAAPYLDRPGADAMTGLLALTRRLSQFGLWFGGALILLAAILIGIDVVLRVAFNSSIGGADELSGYALAIGTAWALGAAMLERAHIRIDSLYIHFPSPLRMALDAIGLFLMLVFFGLIGWHGIGVFQQSLQSGSRSQSAIETPLVIPQALWLLGLALFLLTGTILLLHALRLMLRGDAVAVARAVGTKSAEEEVEEEIEALRGRAARQDERP
ncbi:MAG: TRAP transporter small permease [Hyphomicrobiaceae bacterium]|nr:MAG: TRAP transporter small permease [Hyphomicrobiaceae bacterium]